MNLVAVISAFAFATLDTEVPIIGILSQEAFSVNHYFPNKNYTSFISASYVKFVEAAGARAVPVWINQSEEYYKNIVKHTNGLLLPGGSAFFTAKNGYYDAAKMMYEIASNSNKNGDYYPIFGICLGMEFLAVVGATGMYPLTECSGKAVALPVKFDKDFRLSKLFRNADNHTIKILESTSVTYNNHQYCVTPKSFDDFGINKEWKAVSTSIDKAGAQFISIIENKMYPFYGLQFHPEKNIFGHELGTNVPHSEEAIKTSQYFANFFVFESRKNGHRFPNWLEEHSSLIYNYQPLFIHSENSLYEQLYMFE